MFERAQKKKAQLRLAVCGPSGSGKTYGALMLAQGLGGRIAMIDTEHHSGELYADLCEYDIATLDPPYAPERYIELIKAAEESYDVLIIDSLSHAWSGEGGILDIKDRVEKASRSGNGFAAWREVTPQHNRLVDTLLSAKCHVITTMRTKTAYELQEDDRGRKKPVKIGLAPVQRDGMEYEFTVVLDLSVEGHIATASKDRTRILDGKHVILNPEIGAQLKAWLEDGIDPSEAYRLQLEKVKAEIISASDIGALTALYGKTKASIGADASIWQELRDAFSARGDELKSEKEATR